MKWISQTANCFIAISISLLEIDKEFIELVLSAAFDGDVSEVNEMLNAGVPVDSVDGTGRTALGYAAHNNRTDITQILSHRGADVDKRSKNYEVTVLNNNIDVTEVLLKHGAPTEIKDRHGRTPIDVARERNSEQAVRLLELH